MKTKIIMTCDDHQDKDWKKGETGYIDGYVTNHDSAYCVVILNDRAVMCKTNQFKVTGSINEYHLKNNLTD